MASYKNEYYENERFYIALFNTIMIHVIELVHINIDVPPIIYYKDKSFYFGIYYNNSNVDCYMDFRSIDNKTPIRLDMMHIIEETLVGNIMFVAPITIGTNNVISIMRNAFLIIYRIAINKSLFNIDHLTDVNKSLSILKNEYFTNNKLYHFNIGTGEIDIATEAIFGNIASNMREPLT